MILLKRALIERGSEGTGDDDDLCDESVHAGDASDTHFSRSGQTSRTRRRRSGWLLADSDSSARGRGPAAPGLENCEMRK